MGCGLWAVREVAIEVEMILLRNRGCGVLAAIRVRPGERKERGSVNEVQAMGDEKIELHG